MAGLLSRLWDRLRSETNDPARLFAVLAPPPSDRKRRLFAVACCRAVRSELNGLAAFLNEIGAPEFACDVEAICALADDFADGRCAAAELEAEGRRLGDIASFISGGAKEYPILRGKIEKMWLLISPTRPEIANRVRYVPTQKQCEVFRELFGNPFRPVSFSPSWRTDSAVALARTMYESREFSAMPILADALQDAGCDSAYVLDHCRDSKQVHVRGCWVVDLVLGKE